MESNVFPPERREGLLVTAAGRGECRTPRRSLSNVSASCSLLPPNMYHATRTVLWNSPNCRSFRSPVVFFYVLFKDRCRMKDGSGCGGQERVPA